MEFIQDSIWRLTLPPDGNSFTTAFESFRWNKDVTIMIVYEMRVDIVALHQRAFYSREDYNKDKKYILTPPSCCITITMQLCGSSGAKNQVRDLQMFYLCADFSMSRWKKGFS